MDEGMQREVELLLRSARVHAGRSANGHDRNGAALAELTRGDVDWAYVTRSAWRHGVTPLIYRSLSDGPSERVPRDVLERLRAAFHKQGLMIHMQVGELQKVLDALSRRDVPAIVFKGPALGVQAYGNPMLRKPGDLDLLIRKEHFGVARSVLEACGYVGKVHHDDEEAYLRTRGGIAFARDTHQVDLHWTLEQRRFDSLPFAFQLPSDAVWRDSSDVRIGGRSVQTLSPQHHLLFVCFHGAKHFWQRLYQICDVAELIHSHPQLDWPGVLGQARELKMRRILHVAVHLAHHFLDAPVPASVVDAIRHNGALTDSARKAEAFPFEPNPEGLGSHLFRMEMLESVPEKISYVFHRSCRKFSKLDWSL